LGETSSRRNAPPLNLGEVVAEVVMLPCVVNGKSARHGYKRRGRHKIVSFAVPFHRKIVLVYIIC
jgi:hypothetical protein